MGDQKKYRDDILELNSKGLTPKEIAEELHIKYQAAYNVVYKSGVINRKPTKKTKKDGKNWDRHKCKSCIYRSNGSLKGKGARCEYILFTGKSRGCEVHDCNKYKKGPRLRKYPEYIIL